MFAADMLYSPYLIHGRGQVEVLLPFLGTQLADQASNILAGDSTRGESGPRKVLSFDDSALVEQTRRGDMQAFGTLVAKYQDRIFNMILRMCHNHADAEELTQDAFLRAMDKISQFRGNSRFYTWLFRIAANLALSHRRRGGRVKFQSMTGLDDQGSTQADRLTAALAARRQESPEKQAMSAETSRRVAQAIEDLDDEFRLVIILRDIEGMNYEEIAEVTGAAGGTVKSRLHRARLSLREKLADLIDV